MLQWEALKHMEGPSRKKVVVNNGNSREVYVVFAGRQPRIYQSWPECHIQVNWFSGARYQSYGNIAEAEEAYHGYIR